MYMELARNTARQESPSLLGAAAERNLLAAPSRLRRAREILLNWGGGRKREEEMSSRRGSHFDLEVR